MKPKEKTMRYWVVLPLLTAILWGMGSAAHAQPVTVFFDISASTSDETTRSAGSRDSPLTREGVSRRSVMTAFVAETIRKVGEPIVVVPWSDVTFSSFVLVRESRRAALRQLRLELSKRSGFTWLGKTLEKVVGNSGCTIYVVLTDEVPDKKGRVRQILSRVLEIAPVGVFVVRNPNDRNALAYFRGLSGSPRYAAEPMREEKVLGFIEAMREEVLPRCPIV